MAVPVLQVEDIKPEHFGSVHTLQGMLLVVDYHCWLVPRDAEREVSSIRNGVRIFLRGLAMEAKEFPLAYVTNGWVWISVEEVEIRGQLASSSSDECIGQLADIESLVFRAGGQEKVVNLDTITRVPDYLMKSLEAFEKPEDRERLLKRYTDERLSWGNDDLDLGSILNGGN